MVFELIKSLLEAFGLLLKVVRWIRDRLGEGEKIRQEVLNCKHYGEALRYVRAKFRVARLCSDVGLVLLLALVARVARRAGLSGDIDGFVDGVAKFCSEKLEENAWCRYIMCESLGVKFDKSWHRKVMRRKLANFKKMKFGVRNPYIELIRLALEGERTKSSFAAECRTTWQNVCKDIERCLKWALSHRSRP